MTVEKAKTVRSAQEIAASSSSARSPYYYEDYIDRPQSSYTGQGSDYGYPYGNTQPQAGTSAHSNGDWAQYYAAQALSTGPPQNASSRAPAPSQHPSSLYSHPSYSSTGSNTSGVPTASGTSQSSVHQRPSFSNGGPDYYEDPESFVTPTATSSPPANSMGAAHSTINVYTHPPENSGWRFPEPRPQFYEPNPSQGTVTDPRWGAQGNGSLTVPSRTPSHRSTMSQERAEFQLPWNASELSVNHVGELMDQLGLEEDRDGSRTPRSMAPSVESQALSEAEEEQERIQNGLDKFQDGTLEEKNCEWHRLVSVEFRESLPSNDIARQSVIFEVIKSERDYVRDLALVEEIFINPLMAADPPVITPETRLRTFRNDVFQNITDILALHRVSLEKLFERQREQHPIVVSIADIELDSAFELQPEYEAYIKQYPIAESRHRRELKANSKYRDFIEAALKDPRLLKRGIIDLISRPVTRLPRVSLTLQRIFDKTDKDHPDAETMPLTLNILSDFVKSTEPGVAVADAKVKFWALCEGLVYRPGEIIEMDLYDPQRHLVYSSAVGRRNGSDWRDVNLSLLDNFVLITSPEVRQGRTYNVLISRPIPLECLGLGSFKDAPVSRKEENGSGRLSSFITSRPSHQVFPFTVFNRLDVKRRYTFYVDRENLRTKWYEAFVDAMAVRNIQLDVNKWYAPEVIDDGVFVTRTLSVPSNSQTYFSGQISGAATWLEGGRTYIAVSANDGIYAALLVSRPQFRMVLKSPKIRSIAALDQFHKLIVLKDTSLVAYNLKVLVNVVQGKVPMESFEGSMEHLAKDSSVLLFSAGIMAERNLVVYAVKGFRNTTMRALEAVAQPPTSAQAHERRSGDAVITFRNYGSEFYIPRDVFGITMLRKTLAISTASGIAIVEPTQVGNAIAIVPDWNAATRDSNLQARAMLKERCDSSHPLGLAQSGDDELMVIYESFGCYITKHGEPARKHGFIRWENPIHSFLVREPHVLLVGSSSIEVRHTPTGRLLQVLEGKDIRLLQGLPKLSNQPPPIIIARRGEKNNEAGMSDQLIELVPTAPLEIPSMDDSGIIWDEWGV
ncbi:hypothetical protein DL93DRAFT_2229023 [Clavulina sp. PMI_390]|nr:hypothetical protein DL93DRAFT_2229023 [Clavulina sp. PMI_390]